MMMRTHGTIGYIGLLCQMKEGEWSFFLRDSRIIHFQVEVKRLSIESLTGTFYKPFAPICYIEPKSYIFFLYI